MSVCGVGTTPRMLPVPLLPSPNSSFYCAPSFPHSRKYLNCNAGYATFITGWPSYCPLDSPSTAPRLIIPVKVGAGGLWKQFSRFLSFTASSGVPEKNMTRLHAYVRHCITDYWWWNGRNNLVGNNWLSSVVPWHRSVNLWTGGGDGSKLSQFSVISSALGVYFPCHVVDIELLIFARSDGQRKTH